MSDAETKLSTRLVHLPSRHAVERAGPGLAPSIERSTTFALTPEGSEAMVTGEGRGDIDIYGRYGTSTSREAAALVAELEGGESGLMFSSGMGAISAAFFALVPAGASVAVSQDVYGGTEAVATEDLPARGITVARFDASDPSTLQALVDGGLAPSVVWCESISNPLLKVAELEALSAICKSAGAKLVVDGTFSAGVATQPLARGADLVVHSATKYIGGHSDVIAGCAVGGRSEVGAMYDVMVRHGSCIDPFGAWLVARGIRTLPLRFERQAQTAAELARRLRALPNVVQVNYPGLEGSGLGALRNGGGVLSFELESGAAAQAFVDGVRVCTHAVSLGGIETLVGLPRKSSHTGRSPEHWDGVGIREGLVRVAVGLEDVDDLWTDFARISAD
jgi:cystathionine beta-lyase/cystathionine gamma-synthase